MGNNNFLKMQKSTQMRVWFPMARSGAMCRENQMPENKTNPFAQPFCFGCQLRINHKLRDCSASPIGRSQDVFPYGMGTKNAENMATPFVQPKIHADGHVHWTGLNKCIKPRASLLVLARINPIGLPFADGLVTFDTQNWNPMVFA